MKLELHLEGLFQFVAEEIAPLSRQGRTKKTAFLTRLLNAAFFGYERHRSPLRALTRVPPPAWKWVLFSVPLKSRTVRKGLGGSTGRYKEYLAKFFQFPERNDGYRKNRRLTKPYLVRDDTVRALTAVWRDDCLGRVLDSHGCPVSANDLPSNGIVRTSFSRLHVPSVIPFDVKRVTEVIERLEARGGLDGATIHVSVRRQHVLALRHLYLIRKWQLVFGGVPNLYADSRQDMSAESGSGRLHGINTCHLQSLPAYPRSLLYEGTGWFDCDFRACHPTIALALARTYGIECPYLADYVEHRARVSQEVADEWEIHPRRVKRLMNAVIYGQPMSLQESSSFVQMAGSREVAGTIRCDLYYRGIRAEVREIWSLAIEQHTVGDSVINPVGKVRRLMKASDARGECSNKLFSHIVTGYEAWALNKACEDRNDLCVLMHDGWVCQRGVHTGDIEFRIRKESLQQLGVELGLTLKVTSL